MTARIGALCAGYGGLDLALEAVTGAELAWCAEYDKHASKILAAHWPDVPNLHDITAIDWTALAPVDWLTAGYPCQPFSHAGKRKGAADERHIWPHVLDAVRHLRPRNVLLENVAGHLSLGFGRVLGDLAALGYDTSWTSLRAADVGAPHGRLRVFILAADTHSSGTGRNSGAVPCGGSLSGPAAAGLGLREPAERGPVAAPDTRRGIGFQGRQNAQKGQPDTDGVGGDAPSDACREGLESGRRPQGQGGGPAPVRDAAATEWGTYGPAVHRWEAVLGRPAPTAPTEPGRNGPRLSPLFVEWMMGLPGGWVTDIGIPRNAQLKALGNGVVPQQAAAALAWLLDAREVAA